MKTHRPDAEQLMGALSAAEQMLQAGDDPRHVARALHYLHARCQLLEGLLDETDRYLRFGLPEHELSRMRLLVARLREDTPGCDGELRHHQALSI